MTLARRIAEARRQAGLTQADLADRLGVAQSTLARWESGAREPARAVVRRLAQLLRVSAGWLESGEGAAGGRAAGPPQTAVQTGDRAVQDHKHLIERVIDHPVIAFQGVPGAYSHLACTQAFPAMRPMACASFEDAFQAVETGEAGLAMIPIENSLGGRVADVHHLLPENNLYIVAEHFQPVHHCLLAPKGATLAGLKTAASHPQALSQCRKTLRELNIRAIKMADTAGAAQAIAEAGDVTAAAVASELAAETYDLEILRPRIEDKIGNVTRFVVMAKQRIEPPPGGVTCLTSFVFTVRSVPAALYKSLGGFATNGVNMIRLESYISVADYSTARFYAEIEGHPGDKNVDRALEELDFYTTRVKLLGTYPQAGFRAEE